jgi:hypothetical protein
MNFKPSSKDTAILSNILSVVTKEMNLARARCFSAIIQALIQSRSLNYSKISCFYDDGRSVKIDSRIRQIQRFVVANLITDLHVYLIFNVLNIIPGKIDLVMDRTNWKRKGKEINILAIGARFNGCAIPLIFTMLPKKGNSNTQERIELINRIIRIIGLERINSLTADREFVGTEWFKFLKSNRIRYFMRIKSVNKLTFKEGKTYSLKSLFKGLPVHHFAVKHEQVTVFGHSCYVSAARVPAKGGKTELLIIASFDLITSPFEQYKQRWQVETMFRGFKTSGFNFNQSHVIIKERVESLLRLMFIAYIICYKAGVWLIENGNPIKRKSHGRFEKSILKHGLDHLIRFLIPRGHPLNINPFISVT